MHAEDMTEISRDVVALLGRLVAAPSPNPPGDERYVAAVVNEAADALRLPAPQLFARDPTRPNLILEVGEGTPRLVLAAHLDTMPPGNLSEWESDPFVLTQRGGRLYGLGSADMKGAIAAALLAISRWTHGTRGRGSVALVLAADEENCSAFGMEWLAQQGLLHGDAAVLLEPSSLGANSWEELFIAQRGSCLAWLVAHGEPGHSGAHVPRERRASFVFAHGLYALVNANLFVGHRHPVDGTPVTVNIATIVDGGMVPYAHPAVLRAAIEVRTIEGLTLDDVLAELRRPLIEAGLADRVEIVPDSSPARKWFDPGLAVSDQRLLAAISHAWRSVLGPPPRPTVMPAGTDSTHLNTAGIPTLPAFGPGSLAVAHRPNESIAEADLIRSVDLFESLIRAYMK